MTPEEERNYVEYGIFPPKRVDPGAREEPEISLETIAVMGSLEFPGLREVCHKLVDGLKSFGDSMKSLEEAEEERKRRQRYESRRNRAPHPRVLR